MSEKAVKSFRTLTTELAQFTKICSCKNCKFTVSKAIILAGFTALKPQKFKFMVVNVSKSRKKF
jgi:hypothetical protein